MTKAGWEKTWSTRDLTGGFNGLKPDGPRKYLWALQGNYFKLRCIFEVDCKIVGEIR